MNPSETQVNTTPIIQDTPEINSQIKVHKSKLWLVRITIIFTFFFLIGITILVLWNSETKERSTPNLQKETEQIINEVKKEIDQGI